MKNTIITISILMLSSSIASKAQISGPTRVSYNQVVTYSDPHPNGKWSSSMVSRLSIDSVTGVATGLGSFNPKIFYTYLDTTGTVPTNYCVATKVDTLQDTTYASVALIKVFGSSAKSVTVTCCTPITITESSLGTWISANTSYGTVPIGTPPAISVIYTPVLSGVTNTLTFTQAASGCPVTLTICH